MPQAPSENIVLFTGDDNARLDKALAAWAQAFAQKHGEENIQDLDFGTFVGDASAWSTALAEMLTPSLFASKRLVVLHHFPYEGTRKPSEETEQMEQRFLALLEQIPEEVVILLVSRRPDKRRAAYKKLISSVRLKEFYLKDIDVRVQVTLELAGMIATADVPYVVQVLESRRESLAQDMTMLRQYGMTSALTRDAVDKLCPPKLEESIFIILEAVFAGRKKEALQRLEHLFQLDVVPLQVLGAFAWQMEQIALAKAALEARLSVNEAAVRLDMKPFSLNKAMRVAGGLSAAHIGNMIHQLASIDRLSKNGGISLDTDERDFAGALASWIMRVPAGASA